MNRCMLAILLGILFDSAGQHGDSNASESIASDLKRLKYY